jgi:hypothetical protein
MAAVTKKMTPLVSELPARADALQPVLTIRFQHRLVVAIGLVAALTGIGALILLRGPATPQYRGAWRDNQYLRYAIGIPLEEIRAAHSRAKQALLDEVHRTTAGVRAA